MELISHEKLAIVRISMSKSYTIFLWVVAAVVIGFVVGIFAFT